MDTCGKNLSIGRDQNGRPGTGFPIRLATNLRAANLTLLLDSNITAPAGTTRPLVVSYLRTVSDSAVEM